MTLFLGSLRSPSQKNMTDRLKRKIKTDEDKMSITDMSTQTFLVIFTARVIYITSADSFAIRLEAVLRTVLKYTTLQKNKNQKKKTTNVGVLEQDLSIEVFLYASNRALKNTAGEPNNA